jgi:hypothetical protein
MYVIQRDLEIKCVKYATLPDTNTVQEEQGTCQSLSDY